MRQPSHVELRASAGRIVDMLQQLVIARPEMIVPLEEIVKGMLARPWGHIEQQRWPRADQRRALGRSPLPPESLGETAAVQELPETPLPPAAEKVRGKQALRSGEKQKRR